MNTIVLTGGGTAGHVTPHITLEKELRKHFEKIIYIGSKNGIEKQLYINLDEQSTAQLEHSIATLQQIKDLINK